MSACETDLVRRTCLILCFGGSAANVGDVLF